MGLLRYPSDLLRGAGGLLMRGVDLVGGGLMRAAPQMLGDDPMVQDPMFDRRQATSNALMSAGNTMVQAGGGPTRWGEMRGSPLASVMAGLAAGRESYQTAQNAGRESQQRRGRYAGLLGGASDRAGLLRVYQRAIENGDLNEARTAATMYSALGASGIGDPEDVRMNDARIREMDARIAQLAAEAAWYNRRPGSTPQRPTSAPITAADREHDRRVQNLNTAIDDARARQTTLRQRLSPGAQRRGVPVTAQDSTVMRDLNGAAQREVDLVRQRDSLGGIGGQPATQKRVITADQREFLRARGQWNPELYEVR